MHFALDVRCTSDDTISVTSKDLQLDPQHPGGRSGPGDERSVGAQVHWRPAGA